MRRQMTRKQRLQKRRTTRKNYGKRRLTRKKLFICKRRVHGPCKQRGGDVGIVTPVADTDAYVVKTVEGVPTPMSLTRYKEDYEGNAFGDTTGV